MAKTRRSKASVTPPHSPKRPRKSAQKKVPQIPNDTGQAASSDLAKLPMTSTTPPQSAVILKNNAKILNTRPVTRSLASATATSSMISSVASQKPVKKVNAVQAAPESNLDLAELPMTSTTPLVQSTMILNNNAKTLNTRSKTRMASATATSSVTSSVAPQAPVKKVNASQAASGIKPKKVKTGKVGRPKRIKQSSTLNNSDKVDNSDTVENSNTVQNPDQVENRDSLNRSKDESGTLSPASANNSSTNPELGTTPQAGTNSDSNTQTSTDPNAHSASPDNQMGNQQNLLNKNNANR